jgi:DNA-directed RNA polymerase subunit K/omega
MADIKTQVQGIDPNLKARNLSEMSSMSANIYETINIISRRALELNSAIKTELHGKLEEFAVTTDTIEEIQENKEQIEISKFYEKLPNPTVIATTEFLDLRLEHEYKQERDEQNF